ncbi:hypothetical protein ALC57_03297 [Trachymyrmex cornetzi]|uniref:Uncharacterized protein n=1 Tax=Trachymyrmex cornetzi TaxID=471704 RepID=A0A195EFL4_9HYME|nr:hypothetical protein ALC57_03297 [Trachymyrmex cornetzi]
MNTIIHRLTDVPEYVGIYKEIYQFTLQLIQHPLKLSGLGLFDFGNDFLRKVRFYIYNFIFY